MNLIKKIEKLFEENIIAGGLGDNLTANDVDRNQLAMGIRVEFEHINHEYSKNISDEQIELFIDGKLDTDDAKMIQTLETAQEIALDHLAELDDYYTRLDKMEADAEDSGDMNEVGRE